MNLFRREAYTADRRGRPRQSEKRKYRGPAVTGTVPYMDRINRYPRRCGCVPESRYDSGSRENRQNFPPVSPGDNCLCTDQPISLAMAYVKDQPFTELYSPSDALKAGTLFHALNKPYCFGGRRK